MSGVYDRITELLTEREIDLFAPIRLSDCKIIKKYLLDRASVSVDEGSAVMIAVPYLVKDESDGNISEYAKSRDYHLFFSMLFDEILPILRQEFPLVKFEGFTDHSPIDEINAAAASGLGIIGANGLFITEKYSSFIFIGEIVTSAEIPAQKKEIETCCGCGLCVNACPVGCDKSNCLSAITQKKGTLTEAEASVMLANKSVWGCDLCQTVCPYTKRAIESGDIYSPIRFFNEKRTPLLTYEAIEKMPDEEFRERAYSWRGKEVLLRNLRLFDSTKK